MEHYSKVFPCSAIDYVKQMKVECPTYGDKINSENCPVDCWCQRLPLDQFPYLKQFIRNFSTKEKEIHKQTAGGAVKERKKRAKMPEAVRKQKKLKAVQDHRKRIAETIAKAKEELDYLEVQKEKLDHEETYIQNAFIVANELKKQIDKRMQHFHTN